MALVKILVNNLFAGSSFQRLDAGHVYDVDNAIAEKWIASGKAEKSSEKKGDKLVFEVATPSVSSGDANELQRNLNEAAAKISALQEALGKKDAEHAEALAETIKRAEEAESALEEAKKKDK